VLDSSGLKINLFAKESLAVTTEVTQSDDAIAGFEAFSRADVRWRRLLNQASHGLSDEGRVAFHRTLALLNPGPAPGLLPSELSADDAAGFDREADQMAPATLTKLGVLVPSLLGFNNPETRIVQGLFTAVHRLVRLAKARS
jgi:hypothetical protein